MLPAKPTPRSSYNCWFAIVNHPDAGKTTLTEKLLFSGAIQMTSSLKGRKAARHTTSD